MGKNDCQCEWLTQIHDNYKHRKKRGLFFASFSIKWYWRTMILTNWVLLCWFSPLLHFSRMSSFHYFHFPLVPHPGSAALWFLARRHNTVCRYRNHQLLQAVWQKPSVWRVFFYEASTPAPNSQVQFWEQKVVLEERKNTVLYNVTKTRHVHCRYRETWLVRVSIMASRLPVLYTSWAVLSFMLIEYL